MTTTAMIWKAYRVIKYNSCNPDKIEGYYQTRSAAEAAKQKYISEHKLKDGGVCCASAGNVFVEEIEIYP